MVGVSQPSSPRSTEAPRGAHAAPESEHNGWGPDEPRSPRRWWVLLLAAVVVIGLDILTKQLAVAYLAGQRPVRLFGGAVYLDVIRNPGAAFSIAPNATWIISLIAIVVALGIVWLAPRVRSVGWAIGLGLVLAGAVGNLGDRIFRPPAPLHGHVVDFISLGAAWGHDFAVFNLADSSICVGAALIVLLALLGQEYDGGRARRTRRRERLSDPESGR
jgi:signal peptidase II